MIVFVVMRIFLHLTLAVQATYRICICKLSGKTESVGLLYRARQMLQDFANEEVRPPQRTSHITCLTPVCSAYLLSLVLLLTRDADISTVP